MKMAQAEQIQVREMICMHLGTKSLFYDESTKLHKLFLQVLASG